MISILLSAQPLLPNVGYVYEKNDKGLKNAFGGGKKMGPGNNRVIKQYTHKHPFNILTSEIYD